MTNLLTLAKLDEDTKAAARRDRYQLAYSGVAVRVHGYCRDLPTKAQMRYPAGNYIENSPRHLYVDDFDFG